MSSRAALAEADEWTPAVQAAGLEHRSPLQPAPYLRDVLDRRGVSLFELARLMGTSAEQIDKTYGHLLPDTLERAKAALDSFLATDAERKAEGLDAPR
jgi:hypothetical protein